MGELIRLRSPGGKVGVVDVDRVDVAQLLSKGFKRAGTVMIAAHERSMPTPLKRQRGVIQSFPASAGGQPTITEPAPAPTPAPEEHPLVAALPAIGGMVGGTIGGIGGTVAGVGVGGAPGALGGAAVGGAGGEALRQLANHLLGAEAPETSGEALANIGAEGAWQAGQELAGHGVAKVVGLAGRPVMQAALKSTPEAAVAAIKAGLTRTRAGADKLMRLLGEHGERVRIMARRATGMGHEIDPMDLLVSGEKRLDDEVQILGGGLGSRMPESASDLGTYQHLSTEFLRNNVPKGPLTPSQVEELATKFDKIAEPIWDRIARGDKDIPGVDLARARWYRHMADEMRGWLEKVVPDAIDPKTGRAISLAEQNAYARELIELKKSIMPGKKAGIAARIAARTAGPAAGAAIGASQPGNRTMNALYGAGAGAALTSPEVLSWLALRMNDRVLAQILGQAPRAVGYAAATDQTSVR